MLTLRKDNRRPMLDPRARLAANNNADWYTAIFDAHGVSYTRSPFAFRALGEPPPYHSQLVTLETPPSDELLQLIASESVRPAFGLKDSFNSVDLEAFDLVELFSASWIYADSVNPSNTTGWVRITSAEQLQRWETAWAGSASPSSRRQFPDSILDRPEIAIWGRATGRGRFDAGAIANLSTDCVGMTNVHGHEALSAAATLCKELGIDRPIVGYERGSELIQAKRAGFQDVGPLRVAVSRTPSPLR